MQRKYILLLIACALVVVIGGLFHATAKANDGGPNTVFWVRNNKTTCVSISGSENLSDGSFLVFDYSSQIGQKLGRPWAIMERGKCYQVDISNDDAEFGFQAVYQVDGNLRQQFENAAAYKATDNVARVFPYTDPSTAPIQYISVFQFGGVGTEWGDILYDTGIRANEVFPTKYDLDFGVTHFSSVVPDEVGPIVNSQPFQDASKAYESLAKNLESTLQTCDSRVRVEYQLGQVVMGADSVEPGYSYIGTKNIIWRLGDGRQMSFDVSTSTPALAAIEFMGCRPAFAQFIQSHKDDFAAVDRLIEEVVQKYPNVLNISNIYITPIVKRDPVAIAGILAFADLANVPTGTPTSTPTRVSTGTPPTTVLDEPTPEKKFDLLFNSPNPFMRIYVWLPLAALIGMLAFVLVKKLRK